MITIIISLILNLLLGTPTNNQPAKTTSTETEEQPINTMGGGSAWTNNDKAGGN